MPPRSDDAACSSAAERQPVLPCSAGALRAGSARARQPQGLRRPPRRLARRRRPHPRLPPLRPPRRRAHRECHHRHGALVEAPRLADRLDDYLAGRQRRLGLELVDLERGESFRFEAKEGYCYSTIKVLILTTLLRQLQEDDAELAVAAAAPRRADDHPQRQRGHRVPARRGRPRRGANGSRDLVGMEHTEIDERLVGALAHRPRGPQPDGRRGALLGPGARRRPPHRRPLPHGRRVPDQRWGVFAPESSRSTWRPRTAGARSPTATG